MAAGQCLSDAFGSGQGSFLWVILWVSFMVSHRASA